MEEQIGKQRSEIKYKQSENDGYEGPKKQNAKKKQWKHYKIKLEITIKK